MWQGATGNWVEGVALTVCALERKKGFSGLVKHGGAKSMWAIDPSASAYASEVSLRLRHVVTCLQKTLRGQCFPVVNPLWNLWVVEDTSRHGGYKNVSRLCREMEVRMRTVLPPCIDPGSKKQIRAMLRASEYILAHADRVAQGMGELPLPNAVARDFGLCSACEEEGVVEDAFTVYDSDGVLATLSADTVKVSVPRATSPHHQLAVIWGLQQIHEHICPNVNWVVDLSAVDQVPLSLLSVLAHLDKDLRSQGRQLVETGVGPSRLCEHNPLGAVRPFHLSQGRANGERQSPRRSQSQASR